MKYNKFILIVITIHIICVILFYFFKKSKKEEVIVVNLLLDWKPNTNHLGFYVAQKLGYYAEEGIELKILNPSLTTSTALVGLGRADFGVSYANDLIYARNRGVPVVSIAAIIQTNTTCFAWRKSSQIHSVKDFEGKRYGGWGGPEEPSTLKFIMQKNGADFSRVQLLNVGTQDFITATTGLVDFTWEYKGWNLLFAELKGVQIETYCPSEHFSEFDKPSPLIITSENVIMHKKELADKFMKATREGYEFSIKEPEKSAEIFLEMLPELDKKLVFASAKFLAPLFKSGENHWGIQDKTRFLRYAKWMKNAGLIEKIPDENIYINNQFLK